MSKKPNILKNGHALIVIIGGKYQSSVLGEGTIDRAIKYNTKLYKSVCAEDNLIEVYFKDGNMNGMWVFGGNDLHWRSSDELYLLDEIHNTKVKKAFNAHNGAWVMRVYVK